jgi:ribose 5-phosphate isomerase B
MTISIGTDHRGYELKEKLKKYLEGHNNTVIDFGTNSTASVDYPDFSKKVGESVAKKESDYGIVICGSGIGASIAANRVKGVRAVNVNNEHMAEMSRRHNNANVISFGADFVDFDTAVKFLEIFLKTPFDGGERHERRIKKLDEN